MVKYIHCETCKSIYNTEPWIGEVHTYNGTCLSCIAGEQQKSQIQQKIVEDHRKDELKTEHYGKMEDIHKKNTSTSREIDKRLLSSLEQRANEVLSSAGSVDVFIKEIKDDLVEKARERIEETFQSFDAGKIDAQKVVDYAENILNYLSEYIDYMDNVVKKIRDNPKIKVKKAINKVFKESMANISRDIAKDTLLSKKALLKNVYGKAVKCYDIYCETEDVLELSKKMVIYPFTEIHNKLSTLPFYK